MLKGDPKSGAGIAFMAGREPDTTVAIGFSGAVRVWCLRQRS